MFNRLLSSKVSRNTAILAAAATSTYYSSKQENSYCQRFFQKVQLPQSLGSAGASPLSQLVGLPAPISQCAQFMDKHLSGALDAIDRGVTEIKHRTPGYQEPKFTFGLRGTKYFIEFPIVTKQFDAFKLICMLEQTIKDGHVTEKARIKRQDSYSKGDVMSYCIDYDVASSTASGGRCNGVVYLRGMKGENGVQAYKFVLEKNVDFAKLDSDLFITALNEVNRQNPPETKSTQSSGSQTPSKTKYKKKDDSSKEQQDPANAMSSGAESGDEGPKDPITALEQHGCTVYVPDQRQNKLDWEYLAGYESVKRNIEDTVLLALTNADVYDKITAITRMKNETNRPKCVLFEGPPGCGKTTSARIISHQVQIPLVYMPLEAIMSKFYGESESRLAEIFEAAQAMGSVILFIDEIDSLATSREQGLHEATRRILSTLLRKIDSFESDGEVLVICATNRKKDLDPALISRTDTSIRFELPDAKTRSQIFQRYAKQLSEAELAELGELAVHLSGRDIADICKDAERKWASLYIRKQVTELSPGISVYKEAAQSRLVQMKDSNLKMDFDYTQQELMQGGANARPQALAFGSK